MDAGLPRSEQNRADPHGWNTIENFLLVHETRLAEHPFVDHTRPNTLKFEQYEVDGNVYFLFSGKVFCENDVTVYVFKYYESREAGGRLQIRGFSYSYNAHIENRHNILRYDNGHEDTPEEYHRHLFDMATGNEIERRIITRYELPNFYDILTEIQELFETPSDSSG